MAELPPQPREPQKAQESPKGRPWRAPFRSLPSRISFLVLAATLTTSLAVTAISVQSIDSFLREKIDQKLPSILETTADELALFYDQRALEIRVFASSDIVVENLGKTRAPGGRGRRAQSELDQYLSYVLESFPQFETLFLLSPDGERLLWVGRDAPILRCGELARAVDDGEAHGATG